LAYQTVFKRYELKFKISAKQKAVILLAMAPYMKPDLYGRSTIRNIYFDTENYRLIRSSNEKPVYKEKLRIRSYDRATEESTVFVELKKKCNQVVFKRRQSMKQNAAMDWISGKRGRPNNSQIAREIDYFLAFYEALHPAMFISYEREAYHSSSGDGFRITFDENILCRNTDLSLTYDPYGHLIIPDGEILMEVKCGGGIPLWLTRVLTEERIFKIPFSKYGHAYKNIIFPDLLKKSNKELYINA